VDHRSDLFSLGSVLYAMCTGRPPFRAENTVAMIRRVCDDEPRPIREINPEIPVWLARLVERLLAKEPNERLQSASDVEDLLGRYLAHVQQPAASAMPPLPELPAASSRGKPPTRRRYWAAAAVMLLVLLGALGFTEATGVTDVAGTVIRISRGDGALVIEVDDPRVSVSINGDELVITGTGAKEIRLPTGQHRLKAVKDGT
jgi:ferric-dicitrate binding protein FerR (iron transport regulator)